MQVFRFNLNNSWAASRNQFQGNTTCAGQQVKCRLFSPINKIAENIKQYLSCKVGTYPCLEVRWHLYPSGFIFSAAYTHKAAITPVSTEFNSSFVRVVLGSILIL